MNVATIRAGLLIGVLVCCGTTDAQQAVSLSPRFAPGQVMRFSLDFRTVSEGRSEGDIENPAAPRKIEMQVQGVVRVEVLRVLPAKEGGGFEWVRLRTTYEQLALATSAEVPDPQLADAEAQIKRFEGRAIEYTLSADGAVSDVSGLEDLFPEQRVVLTQMFAQLSLGKNLPPREVAPGAKWSSELTRPTGAPLLGYAWRTDSEYLRNEPCALAVAGSKPAAKGPAQLCAVVLSRATLLHVDSLKDATPEEYSRNGLRTAGAMSGSSESLAYVSLTTGMVVSVTQSSEEESNITISTKDGQLRLRYSGKVSSKSQISLMPETK